MIKKLFYIDIYLYLLIHKTKISQICILLKYFYKLKNIYL